MKNIETEYKQLNAVERTTIMPMTRDGRVVRDVCHFLRRSPITISRADRDVGGTESGYIEHWLVNNDSSENNAL